MNQFITIMIWKRKIVLLIVYLMDILRNQLSQLNPRSSHWLDCLK